LRLKVRGVPIVTYEATARRYRAVKGRKRGRGVRSREKRKERIGIAKKFVTSLVETDFDLLSCD